MSSPPHVQPLRLTTPSATRIGWIGTGVMGGMIAATLLAVFFVPVFFVVVRSRFKGSERQRKLYTHEGDKAAPTAPEEAVS